MAVVHYGLLYLDRERYNQKVRFSKCSLQRKDMLGSGVPGRGSRAREEEVPSSQKFVHHQCSSSMLVVSMVYGVEVESADACLVCSTSCEGFEL